jgi:hypothetical protein
MNEYKKILSNVSAFDIMHARERNKQQVTELKAALAAGDDARVTELRALLALDKPLFDALRWLNRD